MATEQVTVIEGDGSSDNVTVTDDPVEDATVESVKQAIGDETTASEQADSTVAATLLERVTALVDVLASGQADDELRVALATDLLTGNLDVNLNAQSGNVEVDLAADSLAGSLDVDLSEISHGTVETTDDGNFVVSDIPATASEGSALPGTAVVVAGDDGTDTHLFQLRGDDLKVSVENDEIDLPTETTLSAVQAAVEAIDDALGSNATDTLRVSSPSDLDVNLNTDSLASALDVDLAGQSAAPIKVELDTDSLAGNLDVDLAAQTSGALDVSGATVPTEQQSPVQIETSGGTAIDPATEQTVSAIKTAAQALDDALASNGTDEIRVTSPSPLDASAAEIDVDLNSQTLSAVSVDLTSDSLANPIDVDIASASAEPLDVSASTVPVEQQTPVQIEDSGGTNIDPATEQKLESVRALLDDLDDALASVASDTLRTEQQSPVAVENTSGTQIDPASNPEIRGGASLQTVVDAVEQSALAQISELEGASLQDVVDAVVDAGLALAIDHPAETRVGLDVSSGVTIGPVPVQRAADIAVAANPTGGGDVSVTVDHTDADGNLFVSDSPISAATSAQSATVARHGTHVRIDLSGTDTSVNFHLDTHE